MLPPSVLPFSPTSIPRSAAWSSARSSSGGSGTSVALPPDRAAEIWRLMQAQEGGEVDLGGGRRALCEAGHLRVAGPPEAAPEPGRARDPRRCSLRHVAAACGAGRHRARRRPPAADPDTALLDAEAAGSRLTVRAWRDGDRMRPLGLGGTKSLQDLFTDRRVPRSLRRSLPVVAGEGDRILWVAGVAISDEAKVRESTRSAVRLHAAAYTGAR